MPDGKLTISEFAAQIKAKYPVYKDIDDTKLVNAMLAKYPVYKDRVISGTSQFDFSGFYKPKNVSPVIKPVEDKILSEDEQRAQGMTFTPTSTDPNYDAALQRFGDKAKVAGETVKTVVQNSDKFIHDQMVANSIAQFKQQQLARQQPGFEPTSAPPIQQPRLFYTPEEVDAQKKDILDSPEKTRTLVRDIAAKSTPEVAKQLQKAIHTIDIANSFNYGDKEDRLQRAEKYEKGIESGDYTYDIKHGKLIKPEGIFSSIASGWNQKEKALDDFKLFQGMSDAELASELNRRISTEDPDAPSGMPNGIGASISRMLASQPVAGLGAGAVTTLAGNPEASPFVAAAIGGPQMGAITYGAALPEFYKHFKGQGMTDEQAAHQARILARNQGLTDAAVGTLMMAAGGKLGSTPKFALTGGFKSAIEDLVGKGANALGESLIEPAGISVLSEVGQRVKNAFANKAGIKTDSEAGTGEALGAGGIVLGMKLAHATLAKGAKALGITQGNYNSIKDGLSRLSPEENKAVLQVLVDAGHLTQEEADQAHRAINKERELNNAIDLSFPGITDEARQRAKDFIARRDALEEKVKNGVKAQAPIIKEKIDAIDNQIIETGDDTVKPITNEVKDKLKEAGYTDEQIANARPSEVDELLKAKEKPEPKTEPTQETTTEAPQETPRVGESAGQPAEAGPEPAKPTVEVKMHEKVPMENPVHRVTVNGRDFFIQRGEDLNNNSGWYEVKKEGNFWTNARKDGAWEPSGFRSHVGYTKAEAVETITKREGSKPPPEPAKPKEVVPHNDEQLGIKHTEASQATKEEIPESPYAKGSTSDIRFHKAMEMFHNSKGVDNGLVTLAEFLDKHFGRAILDEGGLKEIREVLGKIPGASEGVNAVMDVIEKANEKKADALKRLNELQKHSPEWRDALNDADAAMHGIETGKGRTKTVRQLNDILFDKMMDALKEKTGWTKEKQVAYEDYKRFQRTLKAIETAKAEKATANAETKTKNNAIPIGETTEIPVHAPSGDGAQVGARDEAQAPVNETSPNVQTQGEVKGEDIYEKTNRIVQKLWQDHQDDPIARQYKGKEETKAKAQLVDKYWDILPPDVQEFIDTRLEGQDFENPDGTFYRGRYDGSTHSSQIITLENFLADRALEEGMNAAKEDVIKAAVAKEDDVIKALAKKYGYEGDIKGDDRGQKFNSIADNIPEDKLPAFRKEFWDAMKKQDEGTMQEMGAPGSKQVKAFVEQDVKPSLAQIGNTLKSAVKIAVRALSPKTGVDKNAIAHIHGALGERTKANAAVDKALGVFETMFNKMPESDRINFIDRYKRGQPQATPEMQAVADIIKKVDKDLYDEVKKYNPSQAWMDNHMRVLWKTIPGSGKEKFWSMMTRRPIQGTKGFMKMHTLEDMSEGIRMGGEPVTTNPIKMFKLAYADAMKYVSAQRMWEALKNDHLAEFVRNSDEKPEGMVPLNDRLADVYFRTPEGLLASPGKYYVDEGAARLLNNHLSRDYIRETEFGQGLMALKNLYTQVELGLSMFHGIAMGLEATSSQIGMGLRKIFNFGLSLSSRSLAERGKYIAEGVKDMATSPIAGRTTYKAGRQAINAAHKFGFASSPETEAMLDHFYKGGGLTKQHEEMRSSFISSLQDAIAKDNLIGAAVRAVPALNELLTKPIFEHWIPALKVGMFMREFPLRLKENAKMLASGETTEAELARAQVASIDNRLGELNFDNLFWNRTFKTAMQFNFRSVTWKLGNLRELYGAPVEQMMEFANAYKNKRAPILMPKMAWLMGLGVMQVGLASVIMKTATGKWPNSLRDFVAPQINKDDESERVVLPTYWKDVMHMAHSPVAYVKTSASGPIGKVADIWANKDFYGYDIRDPNAPWGEQAVDVMKYFAPKPFSISSAAAMVEKGENPVKVGMSFLGLNKAPGYLSHSAIENNIFDLYNIRNAGSKPKDAKKANDAKREIRQLYRSGNEDKMQQAENMADSLVKAGVLRPTQVKYLFQHAGKTDDATVYFFKELPFEDKKYLYNKMTDEEKKRYDPKGTFGKQVGAIKAEESTDFKPWNPNE